MAGTAIGVAFVLLWIGYASADAGERKGITGDFEVAWTPGDPWVSVLRTGASAGVGALRWRPAGGCAALPVFDALHVKSVAAWPNPERRGFAIRGTLDWAAYTVGIDLPSDSPGLVHLWLDVCPTQLCGPEAHRFSGGGPALIYAAAGGAPLDPDAVFYFETPVPFPVRNWSGRADMNQFVFFGDRRILDATVLAYADFTAMNDFFIDGGTRMFTRIPDWDRHEDIVAYPSGAGGTTRNGSFRFGLVIPEPARPLTVGKTYRVSDTYLALQPGAPPVSPATEPSARFLNGYRELFAHIQKPEPQFHPWDEWTDRLVDELDRRHDPGWVYWTLSGPHWNLLSYLDYFAQTDPARRRKLQSAALRQLLPAYDAAYTNDFGSRGGYGWSHTRETAVKADFWQGYLWPLYIANEYALTQRDGSVRDMVLKLPDVLVDTGRRLDYTFSVFVNINAATNVFDGYEYDYGAAGLYAALMLQYRELTGDARYLDEARRAARKLTSFGFSSGFELNVTALSALTLLRLYRLSGDPQDLAGSYVQLAVIMKHTWLFNPRYERFKDRDLFSLTSCRANLNYANSAEEGMIARLLTQYLREGDGSADRRWLALIADVLRYKAHAWTDGIPALCRDKALIHADKPENWEPIDPNGWVPMEPFGYNFDGKKLGFLNECIYGCNLSAEASLMQFHPLEKEGVLYTEGPVVIEKRPGKSVWLIRSLGCDKPLKAALKQTGQRTWTPLACDGKPLPEIPIQKGWRGFSVPQETGCLIKGRP